MNETIETIRQRSSVRSFTDRPVDDELLETILDAANRAPSAHNRQSWRFFVLRGERREALARLVHDEAARFPRTSAVLLRMASRTILSAPVVVAVGNTGDLIARGTELFRIDEADAHDFFRTMEIQSSAAAVENLLLAAASTGLGAVWLGVLFLIKDEVRAFLGEPEGEFMAVVPIGWPDRPGRSPRKRSIDDIVSWLDETGA